ncbi:MAG TPA: DUF1028 domain-containing protein [Hypericibacter adhaerens]|jgi:uncharacterized Ntn-hydrolase superfamily protein|uniref:Fimbrial assembly protein FimA n=1 Tax=Hypericibacter adhaerens TaxID=2602016 RepID=A0A5J6MVH5_9PROT|nr:DUF1028 domain-containing protein [Hypericibacter adhaerens]QEX21439.1 hypothetical protein FRZ61_13640 [Hypericibacter adhaerens]HWA43198.1 DUF1028 domain-containing protein [Hypericibacter adhaerens]
MTFSIAGRCERTGMFGVAITTSSIAVTSRCPWARAGVGAVSTQNVTDPSIGPRTLDAMEKGASAPDALQKVMAESAHAEYRQVIAIDRRGATAFHGGAKTLGTHAIHPGQDCIAAGNLLRNANVPKAMVRSFEANGAVHLAERLLRALEEGVVAGGELGPVHSGGLIVVRDRIWPLVDLRVDWDDVAPIAHLRQLWDAYEPQMEAYQTRAVDPGSAPAYGVPGDPGSSPKR